MPTIRCRFARGVVSLAAGVVGVCLALARGADVPATQDSAAGLDAATRVTLKSDAPAKVLFGDLGRQSGVVFRTAPRDLWDKQPGPNLGVSLRDATFWTAMRELCEKSGLTVQRIGGEGQMVLSAAPAGARQWVNYPGSQWGPFMMVAQSITRDHQVDLASGDAVSRRCSLTMSLYAEPRLKVLKVSTAAAISRAVDEKGNSLAGDGGVGGGGFRGVQQVLAGGQWVWTVGATLAPPAGAGQTIASLRGSVIAVAQVRSQTIEVERILEARNAARTIGAHRLLVKEVRQAGTGYNVVATITRDAATGDAWREVAAGNMLRLVDAQGRSLTRRSYTNRWGDTPSMDLNLSFGREDFQVGEQVGEPARLIWEAPLEVKEIRIPFEFEGLPLP